MTTSIEAYRITEYSKERRYYAEMLQYQSLGESYAIIQEKLKNLTKKSAKFYRGQEQGGSCLLFDKSEIISVKESDT